MKKMIFALSVALMLVVSAFAQNKATQSTSTLTKAFSLTTEQQKQMLEIQKDKYAKLLEINSIKDTDQKEYIAKLKSIRYHTDISIKRILTTEQTAIFNERAMARRQKETALAKKMQNSGQSTTEIEDALMSEEL